MKFLDRLMEPSTHAGIAGIFQGLKTLSPKWAGLFDGLTMAFGALAMILPEAVKRATGK